MTERISTLLHDEAAGVPVPVLPLGEVLAGGRAIRRRRRTGAAVASVVAALAVVAAGTAILGLDRPATAPEPAGLPDRTAFERLGAWADGDEVHVGNHTATVDGVQELQYSTAGVVVTGRDGLVLITPAGEVEPLGLHLLESSVGPPAVAADPVTANLAYVRALDGGRAQAVVRDLATGDETTVGEPFGTRESDGVDWISGDLMLVSRDGDGHAVDWRTGSPSRLPQRGWWQAAGVSVDYDADGTWTLTSFAGDPLLTVSVDPASTYGSLSPDGRYFAVSDTEPGRLAVYELRTGTRTVIDGRTASTYGWSPDGHLVGRSTPSGSRVEVCDPATGGCERTGQTGSGQLTLVLGTPGSQL